MLRRIKFIALCILLCLSLTGCGLAELWAMDKFYDTATEAIEAAKEGKKTQEHENLLRNVAANNRSKKTEEAFQAVLEAESNPPWWTHVPFGIGASLKAAHLAKQYENLNTAANSDPIYLESLRNGAGEQNSLWDKLKAGGIGIVAIVIVMVAVVLFLLYLRNQNRVAKSSSKVAKAQVKAMEKEVKAIESQTKAVENKRAGYIAISDNSYQRMLTEDCAALGLDPNQVLAQYNGDLALACNQTRLARINQNR